MITYLQIEPLNTDKHEVSGYNHSWIADDRAVRH